VELEVRSGQLSDLDADVVAVALPDGESLPAELAEAPGAADARSAFKKLTVVYPQHGPRVLVAGLGDQADPERLRVVAALVAK